MLRFWIFFLAAVLLTAQDGAEALAILKKSCAGCHNVNSMSSGLSLDSKEAILQGGNRGPAAAVIVAAVKHAGDVKMPKGGKKLSDADVATLEAWVNARVHIGRFSRYGPNQRAVPLTPSFWLN